MMKSVLDNHGYFAGTARYDLIKDKKNPKKAKLSYFVELGQPYEFSRIEYTNGKTELERAVDSIARRSEYLLLQAVPPAFHITSLLDLCYLDSIYYIPTIPMEMANVDMVNTDYY